MSHLSKSAFYTLITQIPTQLFGIISGIFITRLLGPEGRGIYAILYTDISLFNTILGFSITTSIIYFLSSKKLSNEKILGVSILFSTISIFLSVLFLSIWLLFPFYTLLFPIGFLKFCYISWFLLFLILTQITTVYSGFFQGIKNFKIVNYVSLLNSVINIILYGFAFLLDYFSIYKIGIFEILYIGLIVIIINTIQWHLAYVKNFNYVFSFKFDWNLDIKPFFQYMGIGHLSNIINFINYKLAIWVLAFYLDEAKVGIYALAGGLTQMLSFISNPLSQVLLPFLSSEDKAQRLKTFIQFSRVHFTIIFLMAIFGIIIAPFLIPLLYGNDFIEAVILFEIMIFPVVLSCQTRIFGSFLLSDNKVNINLYATIIGLFLTVFSNYFLIKNYGMLGASFASSITYLGIFLFLYIVLVTSVKIETKNVFFITKNDIKYVRDKLKNYKIQNIK